MKTLPEAIFPDYGKFESDERTKALWAAVEGLPEGQQKVLHLHYSRQLPVREISRQLNCSTTTTYHILNRALFALRNEFNPGAYEKMYSILYPGTGRPGAIK